MTIPSPLLVSVADLVEHHRAPGRGPPWVVVDCRCDLTRPEAGHAAWLAGHVPGAVHADLDQVLAAPVAPGSGRHPLPDPARLMDQFGRWGIGPDTRVVAYDEGSGAFAARLWWLLRWLGHGNVGLLDGGLKAWTAAGHALEAGETGSPAACRFQGQPGQMPVVDAGTLLADVPAGRRLLVDVRGAERFRGEVEPIDPVAGHVPGAVNLPYTGFLGAGGGFRSPPELRSLFSAVTGARPAGELAFMCGSGVTACHGIFALELAGAPGAALYPGSWSEWIRDPARPIARG